jgi:transposase-like protein
VITEIGTLVLYAPAKAHVALVQAFQRLKTRKAVAEELGVDETTVYRWIVNLKKKGFRDPRGEGTREDRF